MRNRLLFLAFAFVAYWLLIGDKSLDSVALDPVKPALVPAPIEGLTDADLAFLKRALVNDVN